MRHKISRRDTGQTIIELLVTLSVVVGLTTMLVVYGRTGQRVSNVSRAAEALVFNLRRVQDYALNVRAIGADGEIPCAWGIRFDVGQGNYVIFGDLPSGTPDCSSANGAYDGGPETAETVNMESGVIISSTGGGTPLTDITFQPPSADVATAPIPDTFPAQITLGATGGISFTRTVTVNRVGQIQINL